LQFTSIEDRVQHSVEILEHVDVREAEDHEALLLKISGSSFVFDFRLAVKVRVAVKLDDQLVVGAVEVGDVPIDRELSAELQAIKASISETGPEYLFSGR
jgi:hypothetical protein